MELAEVKEKLSALEQVTKVRKRANENSLLVWYRASAWSKEPIVRFWVYSTRRRGFQVRGESRWVVVYESSCSPYRSEVEEGLDVLATALNQWQEQAKTHQAREKDESR